MTKAFATLGSSRCRGDHPLPRVGARHADVSVDLAEEAEPTGAVVLGWSPLVGTVPWRWRGVARVRVVGGQGGSARCSSRRTFDRTGARGRPVAARAAGETLWGE